MNRTRKIYVSVVCLCAIFILSNCLLGKNYAKGLEIKPNKSYISIMIEENDTLWSISKKNMSKEYYTTKNYIKELKSINNLTSDIIYKGEYIIIPIIHEN
ncbi:LysM peptidoglycan-binding domain-containing protein [Vallitalea longa]|nr:LysM peptidoglycan-binding domain-containing protein [Vallitalea longa]